MSQIFRPVSFAKFGVRISRLNLRKMAEILANVGVI